MADIYDVQVALAKLAESAIYPNGINLPGVANCNVRIFPGFPIPNVLDADLTARNAQVSIFPAAGQASTRFDTRWQMISTQSPTLVMTVTGNQVTISGAIILPQACMILVNGTGYSYGIQANDTLNSIASSLATLIPNASSVGAVVTISGNPHTLTTQVIVSGVSTRELAREKRTILVTVWAPTPLIRSQLGSAILVLFAATPRLSLPDSYYGQLTFSGTREEDALEKVKCYRRYINFTFDYAITQSETDYTIGENIVNTTSTFTA